MTHEMHQPTSPLSKNSGLMGPEAGAKPCACMSSAMASRRRTRAIKKHCTQTLRAARKSFIGFVVWILILFPIADTGNACLGMDPCEEVKRFVLNFCFAYCLPREHHLVDGLVENSDNKGVEDDVVLALDEAEMLEATLTHIKGSRPTKEAAGDLDAAEAEQDGSGATKLHDMTRQMFKLSNSIWLRPSPGARPAQLQSPIASKTMDSEQTIKDHALAKKSAQASRNKATAQANKGAAGLLGVAVGDPLVRKRCPITAALLRDWLRSPRAQENTNAEQHRFLGLVVDRLLVEHNLISAEDANKYCREPMLHLLHGPPGTGKSHCLLFLREIFNLLEYKQGIDYEVVAFQAVNASALAGKTIHHACGFNTDQYNASEAGAVAATTAKRISYWRWLFIDEVSMVGARLLARTDHRLRSVKPDADAFKFDQGGQVRQGLAI